MQAEDDNDAQAANVATAEQVAEMAEFDENFSSQIPLGNKEVRELDYVEFHIIMLHIGSLCGNSWALRNAKST